MLAFHPIYWNNPGHTIKWEHLAGGRVACTEKGHHLLPGVNGARLSWTNTQGGGLIRPLVCPSLWPGGETCPPCQALLFQPLSVPAPSGHVPAPVLAGGQLACLHLPVSACHGPAVTPRSEEGTDCATKLFSPGSAVQGTRQGGSRCWAPGEGGTGHHFPGTEEEGICRTDCREIWQGCMNTPSGPTGRSQEERPVAVVASVHHLEENPASCPKTPAWARASCPSSPLC